MLTQMNAIRYVQFETDWNKEPAALLAYPVQSDYHRYVQSPSRSQAKYNAHYVPMVVCCCYTNFLEF